MTDLLATPVASNSKADIPGPALLWLMGAFFVLLIPQWDRLPLWLTLSCSGLAGWRWLAHVGRVRLPGKWLRGAIMLAMIAGYIATVSGRFTVDTAASFFVIAVGLKWIETRAFRDFYVLFFILTYLATVNFLFEQGIAWTMLNLMGVMLLLVSLQVLNAPDIPNVLMGSWRRMGGLLLKSLPVVILLFLFFPRIAPLWSVPLVSGHARTGISDTVTPGDISNLAQSSERAFRVAFGGAMPAPSDRYWRGLLLERFDGRTWRQSLPEGFQPPGRVQNDGGIGELTAGEYDVLMEPTGRSWAFALSDSKAASNNVYQDDNGLFRFRRPADTPVRYRLIMETNAQRLSALMPVDRRQNLQLPAEGNPLARRFAQDLKRKTTGEREFIAELLRKFRSESYFYTLRPPLMTDDGVDQLLFDVRRGFCAHYAGATAFLLRAAGIPARMVVGYQGGEIGAGGDYLVVRQYDAHAWVEAWVEGEGWLRVDPTAAIAPSRIESGLREAVADEGSFLEQEWASPQRYGDIPILQWASSQLDRINYQWQRWVVGYQGQSQMDLMSRLPGSWSLRDLGYLTAGVVSLALLTLAIVSAWRQRARLAHDPFTKVVLHWRRHIEQKGIPLEEGATPSQVAEQVALANPAAGGPARSFARAVNNHYYGRNNGQYSSDQKKELGRLKRLLAATRKSLRARY